MRTGSPRLHLVPCRRHLNYSGLWCCRHRLLLLLSSPSSASATAAAFSLSISLLPLSVCLTERGFISPRLLALSVAEEAVMLVFAASVMVL